MNTPCKPEWSSEYPAGEAPDWALKIGVRPRAGRDGRIQACREHRWQVLLSVSTHNGFECSMGTCVLFTSVVTSEEVDSHVVGNFTQVIDREQWARRADPAYDHLMAAPFKPFGKYGPG